MSVATYISSIESSRNIIRNKLIELGLAASSDKLDKLAATIEDIINQSAVSAEVKEGETYTIPAGYHNGSGTVRGVGGGGNYSLQTKPPVTPTKKQQTVAPDAGYYGLNAVTVNAIPDAYQDVSSVNASPEHVLSGKIYVTADGTVTPGEMINNGAVDKTLDVTTITYTIPKGFHSGTGTVKLVLETKTVTPTKNVQKVAPTAGKVLSEVTVEPIPDKYQDVSNVDTVPEHVLDGDVFVDSTGAEKTGNMPNNGAVTQVLDTTNGKQSYIIPAGYHNGEGTVGISLEQKTATPTKSAQNITPAAGKVLSKVTVEPIPDEYQDVSGVTTQAGNVLDGDYFVDATGKLVEGTMPDKGAVSATIDGLTTTSYTIPAGKHNGSGTVSLTNDIEQALAAI